MASWPSDSVRTKNWGTETLTDVDLEAQLDVLHSWVNDALDETSGHKHDGTSNEGPKIDTGGIAADAIENAQIADNAVKAENIELQNTSPLVGRNAADTGDVPLISADANDEVLMGNGVVLPEVNVPVTGVNQGAVYVKNDGTQTELFFGEESAGDEVQITKGGVVNSVKAITFDTTEVFPSAAAPTSFTDLDLSFVVGSNKAIVLLRVEKNSGATNFYKFRENGMADDIGATVGVLGGGCSASEIDNGRSAYIIVATDSSGIVEWKAGLNSITVVHMVAYMK